MKRALLSVYDKTDIVDLAKSLEKLEWEIISTGGTYELLKENGVRVRPVEEVTNFPEILDGRVKTLNPYIHGGILSKKDDSRHMESLDELEIKPIDLVINNLYPFEETIKKPGVVEEDIIENIDIGGPTMIRAAAKNFKYTTVVIDPADYKDLLEELENNGETSIEFRRYLARKVFNYTAYYDALISDYFNRIEEVKFPDYLTLAFRDSKKLRYGENPHQEAAFYREAILEEGSLASAKQLHGKELSFNNINDANGAIEALKEFSEPTIVAVKHANPCGIASGETIAEAYEKAYECDPISIFGGIIASNREIDLDTAKMINEIFIELVLAPSFSQEALDLLKKKKNIRLLEIDNITRREYNELDIKKVIGGVLLQDRDNILFAEKLELASEEEISQEEIEDLKFAWAAAKAVKSNGVVLVKDKATIGIGLGEVNRVWAVENAIERAGDKAVGAVLASDGFFPFKDSIEALAEAKISSVIQPGGSIRDGEVIEEANKNKMGMVFTGVRHFKH